MSSFINKKEHDNIAYLQLNRGKSNAMHTEMIEELTALFQTLEDDPSIHAVILMGKEDFFSSGLDLIVLFEYDEEQMRAFWEKFTLLIHQLVSFPKPLIAAITGHSPAGGCVLALCADYRVMAQGDYIIGLNEVPVGIVVPSSIAQLYAFWIGTGNASRFLLEGKLLKPEEAESVGLVDQVVPFDKIQTAATRKAKAYLQFDKNAWRSSKQNIRAELLKAVAQTKGPMIEQVLEQWWAPPTRAILRTIIESLANKKA